MKLIYVTFLYYFPVSYGLSRIRGDETCKNNPQSALWKSYGLSRIRGDETGKCGTNCLILLSYGLSRIRGDETIPLALSAVQAWVLRIEPN